MTGLWRRFWFSPGPAHNLAIARVALAVCALYALYAEHPWHDGHLLARVQTIPRELWEPVGLFKLESRPPPQAWANGAAIVGLLSALTSAMGWRARLSTATMAVSMTLLLGWTQCWGRVVHGWNLPVVLWWTLAFTPSGAMWSVDAGRTRPAPDGAFTWSIRLLRLNVAMMWLLAGCAKLVDSGLSWFHPDNLAFILRSVNLTDPYRPASEVALWIADHPGLTRSLSIGTVVMEVGFIGVLFAARNLTRAIFVVPALAFLVGAAWWLHLPQPAHVVAVLLCLDWGAWWGQAEPAPLSAPTPGTPAPPSAPPTLHVHAR